MVLSMSLLLTLFHNSTHFLSTHRFFSSSLSNQGSLHYWHLTIIIANSLRLSSSLSRFYGVAWLLSGTNISRLCIVLMQFLGIWQFPKYYNCFWNEYISYPISYLLIALKYLENYSICCVGVVTLLNKMISYKLFIFPQYVTNIDPNN